MRFLIITSVLGALSTLLTPSAGAIVPRSEAQFSNNPIEWTGLSKGVNITLYGTSVSDITAQLKSLDPEWMPVTKNTTSHGVDSSTVDPGILCCPVAAWNWTPVYCWEATNVATEIYNLGGNLKAPANNCLLLECVIDGPGIWFCNDSPLPNIQSAHVLAEYADNIVDQCQCSFFSQKMCGQHFSPPANAFNIVVRGC